MGNLIIDDKVSHLKAKYFWNFISLCNIFSLRNALCKDLLLLVDLGQDSPNFIDDITKVYDPKHLCQKNGSDLYRVFGSDITIANCSECGRSKV
jgi:hypothetical protein